MSGEDQTYVIRWHDYVQVNIKTGVARKVRRTVNGIQTHPHTNRPSAAGAVGVAPLAGGKCLIRLNAVPYEERVTGVWYWQEDQERASKMNPKKVLREDGKPVSEEPGTTSNPTTQQPNNQTTQHRSTAAPQRRHRTQPRHHRHHTAASLIVPPPQFVEYDEAVYEDIEEKYQAYLSRARDPFSSSSLEHAHLLRSQAHSSPRGVLHDAAAAEDTSAPVAAGAAGAVAAAAAAAAVEELKIARIHIDNRMFQGGSVMNAIRSGLNLKPTSMDFDINFETYQQSNVKSGYKRKIMRKEVPVCTLPSSNPSIRVEHSIFKYKNQKGDFLYEITRR